MLPLTTGDFGKGTKTNMGLPVDSRRERHLTAHGMVHDRSTHFLLNIFCLALWRAVTYGETRGRNFNYSEEFQYPIVRSTRDGPR